MEVDGKLEETKLDACIVINGVGPNSCSRTLLIPQIKSICCTDGSLIYNTIDGVLVHCVAVMEICRETGHAFFFQPHCEPTV